MNKRIISIIVSLCLIIGVFAACAADKEANVSSQSSDSESTSKISIVTTIFPEYDWVKNILGEKFASSDVTLLLDNGVDLHNYQPTADDLVTISECDLFIYVGGESDEWVEDALKSSANKNMVTINLLETLGSSVKEEEVIEGMQAEEEHHHEDEHSDEEEGEHEEGPEYDEHVWLSLRNTQTLVSEIAAAISKIDSVNSELYGKNAKAYNAQLAALDSQYQEAVGAAKTKTLLFGDRFPFRYMVDDYGLSYYAAFVGCSAETEASFETISFLSNKVDELNLNNVMVIENSDKKIAETIIKNSKAKNAKILTMDSMQGTTSEDIKNGTTYLKIMQNNLEVLKEALN